MKRVHLDHNSTTPLRPEARRAWLETVDALGGNPSSLHSGGRSARDRVDLARARVAGALGVDEDEVVFTSGGTEANNAALFGVLRPRGRSVGADPGRAGLVTTAVEHSSVLEVADRLEEAGHPVTRLGVDAAGRPCVDQLPAALAQGSVALVSVMAANNEVGALTDLEAAGRAVRQAPDPRPDTGTAHRTLLHVDAVQALGRIHVDLDAWGADLASFSAHKVGGPVGTGVLVRRKGITLAPNMVGGEQEHGLRAGTEDVAGIVATSVAIELAVEEREATAERMRRLALDFWREVADRMPDVRLIGPAVDEARLPNTLNLLFPETDGRVLVMQLDLAGLEVSAGSACASGSIEPSHVLRAIGMSEDEARSGVRVSFGRSTNEHDCKAAVEILAKVFSRSRAT